jgi:hypothetical protein
MSTAGLWPATPAMPTPGDVIDYAGTTKSRLDMGFGYDDVPYGAMQEVVAVDVAPQGGPDLLATFANETAPIPERVAAGQRLPEVLESSDVPKVLSIAADRGQPDPVRIEALKALGGLMSGDVVSTAIEILANTGEETALRLAAVHALSMQMMFAEIDQHQQHEIMEALRRSLSDAQAEIRISSLRVLASDRDPELVRSLAADLEDPSNATFAPAEAIPALLAAGGAREHASAIRPFLGDPEPAVRAAAARALAADPQSEEGLVKLLSDREQPSSVRSAALRSLAAEGVKHASLLIKILGAPEEQAELKEEAAAALAASVESSGRNLTGAELDSLAHDLQTLSSDPAIAPALNRALDATEAVREMTEDD